MVQAPQPRCEEKQVAGKLLIFDIKVVEITQHFSAVRC